MPQYDGKTLTVLSSVMIIEPDTITPPTPLRQLPATTTTKK